MIRASKTRIRAVALWSVVLTMVWAAPAMAITVNVVDNDGAPVSGFKWILQEDTTFPVDPANPATDPDDLLSLSFHKSYHPIAQDASGQGLTGNSDTSSATIDAPAGRYYVSVLPYSDGSISGAPVEVVDGTETVTVTAQQHPIPTAQIAVFLFQDSWPLNGAPDFPSEANPGLDGEFVDWTRFDVVVEEPAGRYGIAGGQVIQDAFGNPLGTTYNADGTVATRGDGTLHPAPDGTLLIRNLAPGKYGIIVNPPTGSPWQQTSTIEGSKVIDAWVKANEPPFFLEFGPPGPHVFYGFTKPTNALGGGATNISGAVTDTHLSRAPATQLFGGRPFPSCWVALSEAAPAEGETVYSNACSNDAFSIAGVPDGDYVLTILDTNLDMIIALQPVTVAGGSCNGGSCDLGEIGVFNWFTRLNTGVFNDVDQDGFWDAGETGIGPDSQDVSLRWRDGTIYQNFATDNDGLAPFDETFPFFHWLVAEVSFANKKATGATFVVDAGGEVDTTTDVFPGFGELTPQAQFDVDGVTPLPDCDTNPAVETCTTDGLSRTERGPVLTAATQGFQGQTSVLHFGKTDYVNFDFDGGTYAFVGENGGISGIVYNTTTRAEDDPRFAAAEEWEPGVPRVQVNLYADGDIDSFPLGDFPGVGDVDWNGDGVLDLDDDVIDDVDGDTVVTLADVDNAPLGNFPGPEDIDRDDDTLFDLGDALQVTWTDSWDDSLPEGCQGANNLGAIGVADNRCFDGLRNWNQIRPGVFDGGYAFVDYDLDHLGLGAGGPADAIQGFYDRITSTVANADKLQLGLLPGQYIVEAATPPGYETLREEHKNVDFGDVFVPSPEALAVRCVGDDHVVPRYLQMQTVPDETVVEDGRRPVVAAEDLVDAPFAGQTRPLCDRKAVQLSAAQNAAAEFFLATDVPTVANISGTMLNDLANQFNPNSPAFGEKYAPPNLPVAFYDFNGKLVNRAYADSNGKFNVLLPSTYTANLPQPSGMSPNMLQSCMNDAGPIPNPEFATDPDAPEFILDPYFDPKFSQFCYTFQYMPGATTYLDTPVVSIAAFANPAEFPVDCERPERTPMIASVQRQSNSRPTGTPAGATGPFVVAGGTVGLPQRIRIQSMGRVSVPNPNWDGDGNPPKNITRDYRFGQYATGSTAQLEDADGNRTDLIIASWGQGRIIADVPVDQAPGEYQVIVTRAAGVPEPVESPVGVTLTVGVCSNNAPNRRCNGSENGVKPNSDGAPYTPSELYAVHAVSPAPYPATPIQDAIDAAVPADLILVSPGMYDELVIMWKPVKLQGWGAGAVTLNARGVPTEKLADWRTKIEQLVADGLVDPLPGQDLAPPGFPALGANIFQTEEGAGIFVVGSNAIRANRFRLAANRGSRIDGFTILGANRGGAIVANGYTGDLNIGNNRLTANAGTYGGGVRLGHPTLTDQAATIYTDSLNDRIRIHHNHIAQNGNVFGGAGAGVSIYTGADRYRVDNNWVCGNFSQSDGAGIGHLGRSHGGLIEDNHVIFNESFTQGNPVNGGGIFVGGKLGLQPAPQTGLLLSPGSGTVTIDGNIIRGNLAGAGDGGGIRIQQPNGLDVDANLGNQGPWYDVNVWNNMITNNVAGLAGGGISAEDAVSVRIRHNTVANNDSTATTAQAFDLADPLNQGANNVTTPQPAGIAARYHSLDVAALMGAVTAAIDPDLFVYSLSAPNSLVSNIVHQNRSFFWANFDNPATPLVIETGLVPASCETPTDPLVDPTCDIAWPVEEFTNDLGVLEGIVETADLLDPRRSLLTNTLENQTDYIGSFLNIGGDPAFANSYFNALLSGGAFDEGGNFIQVTFNPLTLIDYSQPGRELTKLFDYHITGTSVAIDGAGNVTGPARLLSDFDDDPRPQGAAADIGADELQ